MEEVERRNRQGQMGKRWKKIKKKELPKYLKSKVGRRLDLEGKQDLDQEMK